jgi:hypothetical protein
MFIAIALRTTPEAVLHIKRHHHSISDDPYARRYESGDAKEHLRKEQAHVCHHNRELVIMRGRKQIFPVLCAVNQGTVISAGGFCPLARHLYVSRHYFSVVQAVR